MLDILNTYLVDAASPELWDVLKDAHKAFDRINLPNYQDGFIDIIMNDSNVALGDTLTDIVNLTTLLQKQILKEHGVSLNQEVTVVTNTLFINSLLDLAEYEDKAQLLKIAVSSSSTNEKFAELVSLTTHKSIDDLLIDIEEVSPACISKIRDMSEVSEDSLTEEEIANKQKQIADLSKLCEFIETKNLDTIRLLQTGMDVGYPFIVYINVIGRDLEAKPIAYAAYELIAMALISSDGNINPTAIIAKYIENYISDIDVVTKITIQINEIILKLQISKKE